MARAKDAPTAAATAQPIMFEHLPLRLKQRERALEARLPANLEDPVRLHEAIDALEAQIHGAENTTLFVTLPLLLALTAGLVGIGSMIQATQTATPQQRTNATLFMLTAFGVVATLILVGMARTRWDLYWFQARRLVYLSTVRRLDEARRNAEAQRLQDLAEARTQRIVQALDGLANTETPDARAGSAVARRWWRR